MEGCADFDIYFDTKGIDTPRKHSMKTNNPACLQNRAQFDQDMEVRLLSAEGGLRLGRGWIGNG